MRAGKKHLSANLKILQGGLAASMIQVIIHRPKQILFEETMKALGSKVKHLKIKLNKLISIQIRKLDCKRCYNK